MVSRQSLQINWVSVYAALAVLAIFSVVALADNLQVNIQQFQPAGSEVNVSRNITFLLNVSTATEADNLTNLSLRVIYPAGFVWFVNSSVGVNDTTDGLIVIERIYNTTTEAKITNGSSFIFNMTFSVVRNAKDFNFTFRVNGTNTTPSGGATLNPFSNFTNSSFNMSSVAYFSNYSLFSTNFTSMLLNILGVANTDSTALGPVLANANGSINFTRPINMSYANLDINSRIGAGFVVFNLSAFDGGVNGPNATAFVRIYNFTGGCPVRNIIIFNGDNITDNPDIYRGAGRDCIATGECVNVTCSNNILSFTAKHFSAFVANGNANLTINNTAVPQGGLRSGTGTPINFTANYTNATLLETINATCEINLTQGSGDMINANMSQGGLAGNPDTYFFNFTPNRTQIGRFSYNITCESPVFSLLVINLTYNVTDNVPPQVVNVTPTLNRTFNQTSIINISSYIVEETGGIGIDDIYVNVTYPNATVKQFRMTNANEGGAIYNFTFNETLLAFGRYNVTIQANDTEGNLNYTANSTFFVNDTVAPMVTNLSPNATNITRGATVNISFNLTDNSSTIGGIGSGVSVVRVNITLPQSAEVITISALATPTQNIYTLNFSNTTQIGRYDYTIDVNDSYNNRNATQGAFFVQTQAPDVTAQSSTPVIGNQSQSYNLTATVTDGDGVNNVNVNITDPDGNFVTSLLAVKQGATDTFAAVYNVSYTAQSGNYTYLFDANDTNNFHNATVNSTFKVNDTIAPNVTGLVFNFTPGNQSQNFAMNVTVIDNTNSSTVNVNTVLFNVTSPSGTFTSLIGQRVGVTSIFTANFNTTIVNESGAYTVRIDANDTSNSRNGTVTGTFTVNDVAAPNVTSPSSDIIIGNQSNSFNLTVTVIDNTNGSSVPVSVVLFNVTAPDNTYTSLIGVHQGVTNVWSAVFNTTINQRFGNYTYVVDANDTVNNRNASVNSTFVVNDVTPPKVTNASPNNVNISWGEMINISANVSDNSGGRNVSVVFINITLPNTVKITLTASLAPGANNDLFIANFSNTTLAGRYNYTVDANDTSNNRNATVGAFFVQTQAPDVTAQSSTPVIGNQSQSYNLTATVTDGDGVNNVNVNITDPDGNFVTSLLAVKQGATDTFAAVYNVSYTAQSGNYTYLFDANDTNNFHNATVNSTFKVNDTIAPNVTGLVFNFTPGNQSQNFAMNVTVIDNTNSSTVNVNTVLFNVTSPSGTFTSLIGQRVGVTSIFTANFNTTIVNESGAYTVRIDANDTSNSRNGTVTGTFTVNDVAAPNVTSPSSDIIIGNQSNSFNLTVTVIDNTNGSSVPVSVVLFNVTAPDNTYTSLIGVHQGVTNVWSAVFNTTINQRFGNYTYVVDANDTVNNRNASVNSTFVVNDVTPPKVTNASPNNVNISWGEMINISANVSDNSGGRNVSVVFINITLPNTVKITLTASLAPGANNDLFIANFSNTTLAGRYNYTVDANDTSNNRNATVGAFFVQSSEVSNSSVSNSTISNSTVDNVTLVDSNVSNSYVNGSTLQNSSASNSSVVNSNVNRSVVENSTAQNSTVSGSTVNQSQVDNSTVINSTASGSNLNKSITDNSTIQKSNITQSKVNGTKVENSSIIRSNLTNSFVNKSFVDPSTITNSSVSADSTVLDSVIENASIVNSTTSNATINRSYVENSTILVRDLTILQTLFGTNVTIAGSNINKTRAENSTIITTNVTESTITDSNLTQVRSYLSTVLQSNITSLELINSTIRNSLLRSAFGNGPSDAGVDDSTLLNVTDTGSSVLQFNRTHAENLTGVGLIHFLCDNKVMEVFNVAFPGSLLLESRVYCTDLRSVTVSGPLPFEVNSSSINSTSGISGVALRNMSISNVNQLTNVSGISSTINDSIINNTAIIGGSSVTGSNITSATVDNSSIVKSNLSGSSVANQSRVDNSTLVASNSTTSILIHANLTQARATRSFVQQSNLTGLESINSSIINSLLPVSFGNGPSDAGVDNSTLVGVTSTGASVLQFNSTRAENVTSAGAIHFLCDRRIMTTFNVVLPGTLLLESRVFCTDLLNITLSGTGPLNINHSSINFTTGINSITVLNSSITNVPQLTNASVIESYINDSTINASNVIEGSSVTQSNITSATVDNSSIVKSNLSGSSVANQSRVDNSTLVASNSTTSILIHANLTQARATRSFVQQSNLTGLESINSSIINSLLPVSFGNGPSDAGVDNSTLVGVTSTGASVLQFNSTRAENVTSAGAIHFLCDRRIMTTFNVVLPGTLLLESRVFCTDLLNITLSGTGPLNINHSSINFTTGINSITVLNSSITNVPQLTNASVIESYINDSTINASNVIEGSSVTQSNITSATVDNSSIVKSNISSSSTVNSSRVDNTTLVSANVTNSTVILSRVTSGGQLTFVSNSTVQSSVITNTTVYNSTIISSNLTRSFVTRSFVDPSTIVNSTVDAGSNITDSRIENSTVIGSNVTNSTVNNSRINGTNIRNSNITNTSVIINVTLVENVTLAGVNLQNIPLVTDILGFIAFNTSFETTVNVTRNATMRLVLNNTMPYNVTNLTVVVLYNGNYLNYSLSSPQSLANASVSGTNYTAAVSLGNVISSPIVPSRYIEVNFTFIALRNHTNVPTSFNVTVIRSDGAVRQFNTTLSQTLTQPLPSRADVVTSGFAQVGTPQENLTTNLSLVPDASNVSGFQLGNQNGTVNWSFHTVNAIGRNGQAIPLIAAPSQGVVFMNGSVTFNTSAWHPSFNTSARITFFGVGCPSYNLVPIVNFSERLTSFGLVQGGGRDCISAGACANITCSGGANGNLSFTALHFTSFASSGNANLTVTTTGAVATQTAYVNATYVNATSGAFITGATCNATVLVNGTTPVNYNMSQAVGVYSIGFNIAIAGTWLVNVTCIKPGFTTLNALDNITISGGGGSIGGGGWSGGGGGGGYYRRPTNDTSSSTTSTTGAVIPTQPKAQTAFDVLDLIKAFYKGVKDYTPFQIIDLIKRFYANK